MSLIDECKHNKSLERVLLLVVIGSGVRRGGCEGSGGKEATEGRRVTKVEVGLMSAAGSRGRRQSRRSGKRRCGVGL